MVKQMTLSAVAEDAFGLKTTVRVKRTLFKTDAGRADTGQTDAG